MTEEYVVKDIELTFCHDRLVKMIISFAEDFGGRTRKRVSIGSECEHPNQKKWKKDSKKAKEWKARNANIDYLNFREESQFVGFYGQVVEVYGY